MMVWDSISDSFWSALRFYLEGLNVKDLEMPNIWVLANEVILVVSILAVDDQQVKIMYALSYSFHCTFVYASLSHVQRHCWWSFLASFRISIFEPWTIVGDVNSILGAHEKSGKLPILWLVKILGRPLVMLRFFMLVLLDLFTLGLDMMCMGLWLVNWIRLCVHGLVWISGIRFLFCSLALQV